MDAGARRVTLGSVSGVHGINGWVKVYSHTQPREQILDYGPWILGTSDGELELAVRVGNASGRTVLAALEGVHDRNQAMRLVGASISVPRTRLPALEEGEIYWADLEGLRVVTVEGTTLGQVSHLIETGANDVLVVSDGSREMLIPWLRDSVVRQVDLEQGEVRVDWDPES